MPINYSKRNQKFHLKTSTLVGSILILACVLLIFNCIFNIFTPLNRLFLGSFGILYIALLIVGIVEGILLILEKKINVYYIKEAIIAALVGFAFLMIIHEITILKLDSSTYGNFISATYRHMYSLGGALFSIILYPIYGFCGMVGTFVILGCILAGLIGWFVTKIYHDIVSNKSESVSRQVESIAMDSTRSSFASNATEPTSRTSDTTSDDDIFIKDEDDDLEEKSTTSSRQEALERLGLRKKNNASTDPVTSSTDGIEANVQNFFGAGYQGETEEEDISNARPRKFVHDVTNPRVSNTGKRILSEKDMKNLEFLRATQGKYASTDTSDFVVQDSKSPDSVYTNRSDIYDDSVTMENYSSQNINSKPRLDTIESDTISQSFDNDEEIDNSQKVTANVYNAEEDDDSDIEPWQVTPKKGEYDSSAIKSVERVASVPKVDGPENAGEMPQKKRSKYVYHTPPMTLLNKVDIDPSDRQENFEERSQMLEQTLSAFKIDAKVVATMRGPAFTRYELAMPEGVPVKRVANFQDDISMRLESQGSVRLQIPIPGKNSFGVEVPNKKVDMVPLRDILESFAFANSKSPLTFGLGKDITGEAKISRVDKLTHLLIAGTTGSGKSVCLNSILISILYKSSPEDVRMLLVDPKRVEFTPYNGIPHLIIPNVITDLDKAVMALGWAVNEMERRYNKMAELRVRRIDEYNETEAVRSGVVEKMPYLLILIDEVGDIMAQDKKSVEGYLQRLLQKSRACGIHIILATQRPSADVIGGVIKTNLPSRIAFQVSSAIESRIIINQAGAEKLLGRGDMLYQSADSSELVRIQGAYLSDQEIQNVVDYVKEHNECEFDEEIENEMFKKNSSGGKNSDISSYDPLLKDAIKIFIRSGKGSITGIQRAFGIGWPRAAKIYDQMIKAGYIEMDESNKCRVVMDQLEFEETFGENFDD